MLRVPEYRASLVAPYREHLRKRRAEDTGVSVKHLFEEIEALSFTGCLNLLHKYINQGRADADRSHISPRSLARTLLTRPDNPEDEQHEFRARLTAACPEVTQPAFDIGDFAPVPSPHAANADALTCWIAQVRAADLSHPHAFTPAVTVRWDVTRTASGTRAGARSFAGGVLRGVVKCEAPLTRARGSGYRA